MAAPRGNPRAPVMPFIRYSRYRVQGVTRDGITNAAVGGVTVEVYEAVQPDAVGYDVQEGHGKLRAVTISDASGNWFADVTSTEATGMCFKAFAYKTGAPNVTGTSQPTLQGVPLT